MDAIGPCDEGTHRRDAYYLTEKASPRHQQKKIPLDEISRGVACALGTVATAVPGNHTFKSLPVAFGSMCSTSARQLFDDCTRKKYPECPIDENYRFGT